MLGAAEAARHRLPLRHPFTFVTFELDPPKAKAGFERFSEVLHTAPDVQERPGAADFVVREGRVAYEDVSFAYDADTERGADGEHVLRGLSLDIQPGHTLALVGPSGGGKSTTCALLPRFYDVGTGRILIDGRDVRDVTLASLHRAIGMVQRDVYLFDATLSENIAYGKPGASDAEIEAAARVANLVVRCLADGRVPHRQPSCVMPTRDRSPRTHLMHDLR